MLVVLVAVMWSMRSNARPPREAAAAPDVGAIDTSAPDGPRPFQGRLEDAVDGAPLDSLVATAPYGTLLWNLKALTVAEVASHAEPRAAVELRRAPARYRGHFVRARGTLALAPTLARLPENSSGYDSRWRAILEDELSPGDHVFVLDLFEAPERPFERGE